MFSLAVTTVCFSFIVKGIPQNLNYLMNVNFVKSHDQLGLGSKVEMQNTNSVSLASTLGLEQKESQYSFVPRGLYQLTYFISQLKVAPYSLELLSFNGVIEPLCVT